MALTVTHAYEATGADDPEAEINRAEWNDDHVITGDYLRKATVTLSSADILDLHNTPVTLVAAPGAGKYLVFHKADAFGSYGTIAYTTGGSGLLIAYGAAAGDMFATLGSGTLTGDTVYRSTEDGTHTASDIINEPLVLATDAAITDGDGTLTVTVWYSIEDVP